MKTGLFTGCQLLLAGLSSLAWAQRPSLSLPDKPSMNSFAVSPDEHNAVTGGNGPIEFWDLSTGRLVRKLNGHQSRVVDVCFSPDGHQIASASDDGTVRLWDTNTGQELKHWRVQEWNPASSDLPPDIAVAFLPGGRQLAVANGVGVLRIYPVAGSRPSLVVSFAAQNELLTGDPFKLKGLAVSGADSSVWVCMKGWLYRLLPHQRQFSQVLANASGISVVSSMRLSADSTHVVFPKGSGDELGRPTYGVAFADGGRLLFIGRVAGRMGKTTLSLDRYPNKVPGGSRTGSFRLNTDAEGVSVTPFVLDLMGQLVYAGKETIDLASSERDTVSDGVSEPDGRFLRNGKALLTVDSYSGFRTYQRQDLKAYYARNAGPNTLILGTKPTNKDRYAWWSIDENASTTQVPAIQSGQFLSSGRQVLLSLENDRETVRDSADRVQTNTLLYPAVLRDLTTGERMQRFQWTIRKQNRYAPTTIPQVRFYALPGGDTFISSQTEKDFLADIRRKTEEIYRRMNKNRPTPPEPDEPTQFAIWSRTQLRPIAIFTQTSMRAPLRLQPIPQTSQFLSVSRRAIEQWDIPTQSRVHSWTVAEPINSVGVSPNGELLAVASGVSDDAVFGLDCGEQYRRITQYQQRAKMGLNDLVLWNTVTGQVVRTFRGQEGTVIGASFLANGELISVNNPGKTRIWNPVTGDIVHQFFADSTWSMGFSVAPDRQTVLLQQYKNFFQLDASTGQMTPIENGWMVDGQISPSGKRLLVNNGQGMAVDLNYVGEGHVYLLDFPPKLKAKYDNYTTGIKQADCVLLTPNEDELVVGSQDGIVSIISVANATRLRQFRACSRAIRQMRLSPNGSVLVTSDGADTLRYWQGTTGKLLRTIATGQPNVLALAFSPDGRRLYTGHTDGRVGVFDAETGQSLALWQAPVGDVRTLSISADGQQLLAGGGDPNARNEVVTFQQQHRKNSYPAPALTIWNLKTKQPVQTLTGHVCGVNVANFSADSQQLVSGGDDYMVRLWNLTTGTSLAELSGHTAPVTLVRFLPDGKRILSRDANGLVIVWDLLTQTSQRRLQTPPGEADLSPDGTRLFIGSVLWDLTTNQEVATFWQVERGNYLTTLPGQQYFGTPGAARSVSYGVGRNAYSFDEFDLQYNRPDLVLRQLGCSDTARISAYQTAYQKRLQRAQLVENQITQVKSRPVVSLLNEQQLDLVTSDTSVPLSLQLKDTTSRINRLHIWVNDVPLYGINGKPLGANALQKLSVDVPLGRPYSSNVERNPNVIQIACTNEVGMTTFRHTIRVVYELGKRSRRRIHFVGIGVDQYRDSTINLRYSTKDIRDLAALFRRLNKQNNYIEDSISIRMLLNEQVTRENIRAVKTTLQQVVKPGDVVVLSLSGHGLLSDSLDFYYGTQDVDIKHPERRGLAYRDLEGLLDSLPTQQKVLLIDACHSGEVDRQIARQTSTQTPVSRNVSERQRGAGVETGPLAGGQTDAFSLMQQTYANLSRVRERSLFRLPVAVSTLTKEITGTMACSPIRY